MNIDGVNIDDIPNILKNGYIQPYIPLHVSNPDGTSGYLWKGELRQSTPEFWAEVEKEYPTIRVSGDEVKQTVDRFKKLINKLESPNNPQ